MHPTQDHRKRKPAAVAAQPRHAFSISTGDIAEVNCQATHNFPGGGPNSYSGPQAATNVPFAQRNCQDSLPGGGACGHVKVKATCAAIASPARGTDSTLGPAVLGSRRCQRRRQTATNDASVYRRIATCHPHRPVTSPTGAPVADGGGSGRPGNSTGCGPTWCTCRARTP